MQKQNVTGFSTAFSAPLSAARSVPKLAPVDESPKDFFTSTSTSTSDAELTRRLSSRRPVTIIPAELVTLIDVALPVRDMRARRAALAFAVEENIAQPLEDVHVALCRTGSQKMHVLAAVVDRAVMERFTKNAPDHPVMPEALLLPAPQSASDAPVWAVWSDRSRAIVRVSDGTGFAIPLPMLETLWQRAQCPAVIAHGASLPDCFGASTGLGLPPVSPLDAAVDLRQGEFHPKSQSWRPVLRWAGACAAFGLVGHLALAGADLWALGRIAETEMSRAEAALETAMPGVALPLDPTVIVSRLVPRQTTEPEAGPFLPLVGGVSEVFLALDTPITWRRLTYGHDTKTLSLLVEAPGLAALQSAEFALRDAGFDVDSGAATATDGAAEAEFSIRSK